MQDGRPSRTALMVAALRAYHYLSTPEPRILSDSLAMPLAGLPSAAHVNGYREAMINAITAQSDRSIAEVMVHNLLMGVCARSRFVEDQLAVSRTRGMQQLIILGAGLDSTAYRCADLTAGLQVFEVDYPATQTWKREQLAASSIAIPDNLKFVAFDFERQTLAEALREGGIRSDAMSFFSWLGVQPYLDDQTVMATLDVMARFAAGSELVLICRHMLKPLKVKPWQKVCAKRAKPSPGVVSLSKASTIPKCFAERCSSAALLTSICSAFTIGSSAITHGFKGASPFIPDLRLFWCRHRYVDPSQMVQHYSTAGLRH